MKETTATAMPPCFEKWCQRFDDVFSHKAQKREFRNYLGGLLGESERKNLLQMSGNAVGVNYHRLHHFLTDAPWSASKVNERGFRSRWATKPLHTFVDALEAFRTAISFRFFEWLTLNRDVFAAHKASFGFIWA